MLSSVLQIVMALSTLLLVVKSVSGQATMATPGPANSETTAAPLVLTLQDAIARAAANDPGFAASVADHGVARLDRSIGRAALLPEVTYHNQYLYTQPNGLTNQAGQGATAQAAPRFISNNAVREYASQALITESLSAASFAALKHADAATAKAAADLEVARRGLVLTVVSAYYTLLAEERSVRVAQLAEDEARSFADLTAKLEAGREVAHADVVKANLGLQQRQRDLADAQLAAEKARLELGVLVLPDPRTAYRLADSDLVAPALPSREASEAAAAKTNPEIKSALAALSMSKAEVATARAAYFPALTLNYTYGIDAPQFAVNGPDGVRNLGYSAFATLDIPVWDWLATHHRVQQSELRQQVAQTQLTATQRKLIANLAQYYDEAKVAYDAMASLKLSAQTAEDSLRLTKLRYSAGEATALEVVDAESAVTLAETASADGDLRYRVALANLQTLTGTL